MKKLVILLSLLLLVVSLLPWETTLTGFLIKADYARNVKKFTSDKDKYVLLPNQKVLPITLTAKDTYIWKAGWYCKQPCKQPYDWTTFDFEGPVLPTVEQLRWIDGTDGRVATLAIPRSHLKHGKNYFAAYTCEGVGKCNGEKWLLLPVDVLILSEVSDVSVSSVYVDFPEKNTGSFFVVLKNTGPGASPSGIMTYKVTSTTGVSLAEGTMVMPTVLSKKTSVTSRVRFQLGEANSVHISLTLDPNDKIIELDETNNRYEMDKEFNPQYPTPPR
ncbi:hypothetical protein HY639_01615 [Candidatus Woesearchaeota archaeon]|nr:hypothetical protein [Candidatus Woesearchaeota archaeon]